MKYLGKLFVVNGLVINHN